MRILNRVRVVLLLAELALNSGVPAPRRIARMIEQHKTTRLAKRRAKSLPAKTAAFERLYKANPGLMEVARG